MLSLWMATYGGEGSIRLLGSDGRPRLELAGSTGDVTVTRSIAAGKCVLEIDASGAKGSEVLFGVKGSALAPCDLDTAGVKESAGDAARHGHAGAAVSQTRERRGRAVFLPARAHPGQPRDEGRRLGSRGPATAGDDPACAWTRAGAGGPGRIEGAAVRVLGVRIVREPLRAAPSAGGPGRRERIPGGWPIAPIAAFEGEALPYPVGIADLEQLVGRPLDLAAARRVRFLFFLGDADDNDAVPYRDSFSKANEELIFRRFGAKPVARWKIAERLYVERGLTARFALYPGAGHEVTEAMLADIEKFFLEAQRTP